MSNQKFENNSLEIIWHIYNYFLQSLNLKINKYLRYIYIYIN